MGKFNKVVLVGILILYLWSLYTYLNTPVKTEIVHYGTMEDSINTTAYVIRTENLLYSNVTGGFSPIAQEGERVSKGAKVATVYKNNVDESVKQRITEINERIAHIKNNQANDTIFSGDIKKLEDRIDLKVEELIHASYHKNANRFYDLKNEMKSILDKKFLIRGNTGASGYNMQELIKEKERYESQIQASMVELVAGESGIVSYKLDQMEQILNPDLIEKFTPSEFNALDNMDLHNHVDNKTGQAVAKVIDNFKWYLGFSIDIDKVYDLKPGESVKVRFLDVEDVLVSASVYYISGEQNGEVVVVFEMNKHIDDIYKIRKTNVEIIKKTYEGLKMPVGAIRVKDGKKGTFVVRDQIARFREVEVLHKDNSIAIVKENNTNNKGLLLYDEVIIKPSNIEEGTLIR